MSVFKTANQKLDFLVHWKVLAFNRRGLLVHTIRRINHSGDFNCKTWPVNSACKTWPAACFTSLTPVLRQNITPARYWAVAWGWTVGWNWASGCGWSPAAQKMSWNLTRRKPSITSPLVRQTPRYCPTHHLCCNQPRHCQQNNPLYYHKLNHRVPRVAPAFCRWIFTTGKYLRHLLH